MKALSAPERRLGAILCNAILVVMELVGLLVTSLEIGWSQFRYYTQNSNYFALIVSAAFLIVACRPVNRGKPTPGWLAIGRFIATCLLTVTFAVIVLILSPPYGWAGFRFTLFTGANIFFHLLCPVLSFVSFFLFEERPRGRSAVPLAVVPTAIYAAVSVSLNIAKVWHGPYAFLYVYEQPVWQSALYAVIILGGAGLSAFLLNFFKGKVDR